MSNVRATMSVAAAVLAVATTTATGAPAADAQAVVGSSEVACQWSMYGQNVARTFSHECDTGISPTTVQTLVPAWFLPTEVSVTASPTYRDGQVFVGDWSGTMHALDAATGQVQWSTPTEPAPGAPFGPIVSSAAVADVEVDGLVRRLVIFGSGPRMYALDATDGSEVWVQYFGAGIEEEETEFESSPLVHDGVIYVGMDVHNRTLDQTGGVRGGVFALDAATGETIWYFNPEWDDERSGCSSVWSSPTLNVGLGLVYGATGNCPHDNGEWTPYVESIFALEMDTGQPVWSYTPDPQNRLDFDYGATPNLFINEVGTHIVGIGKKDGTYYAHDPLTGELLWSTNVQQPLQPQEDQAFGGFIGSTAIWEGNVFGATALGSAPYYHSLSGRDGAVRPWAGQAGPSYGASAAAGGVVFAAALDNALKAFDPTTGAVLWTTELSGPASSGPAIVGDWVFVGAGTSSSDLCAKNRPDSDVCFAVFDTLLGSLGGVHAFQLAGGDPPPVEEPPAEPDPSPEPEPEPTPEAEPADATLPATGGGIALAAILVLVAVMLLRRR